MSMYLIITGSLHAAVLKIVNLQYSKDVHYTLKA